MMSEVARYDWRMDMLSPKKSVKVKGKVTRQLKEQQEEDQQVDLNATLATSTTSDAKSFDTDDDASVVQRYLATQSAMQHQWNMLYLQAFVKLEQQKSGIESQSSATSSAAEEGVVCRVKQETSTGVEASTDRLITMNGNKKNYKNMTRKRRIEANARERSRVHTISAAFEGLRRSVPLYSANQKVSKLAILRIACQYIMALARLAGLDYSVDQSAPTFDRCIEALVQTIHSEGKTKHR